MHELGSPSLPYSTDPLFHSNVQFDPDLTGPDPVQISESPDYTENA